MAETDRRVIVTLTFATTDEAAEVAYSVMAIVRDESRYAHDLESLSVNALVLDEDGDEERRVREQAAREIEETVDADAPGDYEAGLRRAAAILRREPGA